MRRRALLAGLGASLATVTSATATAASRVSMIQSQLCRGTASVDGRFSLESRGLGSSIVRAWMPQGNVAVVVPTVPRLAKDAAYTLELGAMTPAEHLFVCPLHAHWDHAAHVEQWLGMLAPGGHATLITSDHQRRGRPPCGYGSMLSAGVGTLAHSLFDGRLRMTLSFVMQGRGVDGHANHVGSGRRCSPTHRNCGTPATPSPKATYCLFGEFTLDGASFRFFVNDAASSTVAANIPAQLVGQSRPIDLAVLTIPDAHLAYGYPEELLAVLEPEAIRWTHWENFIWFPRNCRRRLRTGRRPRTFAPSILPRRVIEQAGAQGCFVQHGQREFFG